jgi:hypothetical protein
VDESESDQGTPLARKLGIRTGHRVLVLEPPLGFVRKLEPLPEGAGLSTRPQGQADTVLVFVASRAVLLELFHKAAHALAPRGRLWALWPRKSSGFFTDLTEEQVRAAGLAHALVDDKIGSVDEIWAGLRFVFKERDRIQLPRSEGPRASDA